MCRQTRIGRLLGQAEGWDPRGRETMYSFYLAGLSSCGSFSL